MKIDKRWRCKMYPDRSNHSIAGGGIIRSHGERASLIWNNRRAWDKQGGSRDSGANYATMFAYLWRRFGPPEVGWDDHKELVNYYLTTPVEGVGFGLSCSPSFPIAGVFYVLNRKWARRIEDWDRVYVRKWMRGFSNHCCNKNLAFLHSIAGFAEGSHHGLYQYDLTKAPPSLRDKAVRFYNDYVSRVGPRPDYRNFEEYKPKNPLGTDWFHGAPIPVEKLPPSPHRTVLAAMEAGFRDLLRPVNIRDQYINICGTVEDNDLCDMDCVRPSNRAGNGCSPDFIDAGDDWWDLAEAIRTMGVKKAKRILIPTTKGKKTE